MKHPNWLAKSDPPETLVSHTMNCVRMAMHLLDLLPSADSRLREQLILAALTHDLGKAADGFQRVLTGAAPNWKGRRHEALSTVLSAWFPEASEAVVLSVLFHHRTLPSNGVCDDKGTFYLEQLPPPLGRTPAWLKMARELDDALPWFSAFWLEVAALLPEANLPAWPDITGDWRESPGLKALDPRWVHRDHQLEINAGMRREVARIRGLLRTADHLSSAGEWPPDSVDWVSMNLTHVTSLRGFQTVASQTDGDILMQAPTGSGKTEACLLWIQRNAAKNARVFYVLPFTASINAMHQRLHRLFPGKVGVLHSRAAQYLNRWLGETDEPQGPGDRLQIQSRAIGMKQLAREMYYSVRVCTPHQLMRYFLRGPGWEQMLSEFEGACFIFDEVHAYDPRMVGLILGSVKLAREMGARVSFVSATLPSFLRRLISEHLGVSNTITLNPNEPSDREILSRKRHVVRVQNATMLDLLDDIGQELECGSVLVVTNHVKSAQSVYDKIIERYQLGKDEVVLLHGSFNSRDRNSIEEKILSKNHPRLLVATQAVEVSLDISYSCGYFEAAPIDALIQRMGRVNRNGSATKPATINVVAKQLSSHVLYSSRLVNSTLDAFRSVDGALSETELVNIADRVYADGYDEPEMKAFLEAFHHPDYDAFQSRFLAGAHQEWVESVIERSDRTIEVLPLSLRTEYDTLMSQGLWLQAAGLLVSVRVNRLAGIKDRLFTSEEPWQVRLPYSPEKGLSFENTPDLESQFY